MGNTANIETLIREWQKPTLETNKQTNKQTLRGDQFHNFNH